MSRDYLCWKAERSFSDHKILVTFFSPSGYENVVKKKHIADVICYLPFDKKYNKEFISQFNTQLFFTVKYDYWYNLLAELKNRNTKIYVISALFYERQSFFTSYGKWFVKQLQKM
jgi:3-deoxy-D-manno-octulosonic-acid transferase